MDSLSGSSTAPLSSSHDILHAPTTAPVISQLATIITGTVAATIAASSLQSSSIDSIVTVPSSPFSSSVTHHDRSPAGMPVGPFSSNFPFLQQSVVPPNWTQHYSTSSGPIATSYPSHIILPMPPQPFTIPPHGYPTPISPKSPSTVPTSSAMLVAPNITHCHDLLGYIDGSFPCPSQFITNAHGHPVLNPAYSSWLHTGQSLLSWLKATHTKDVFQEIHELTSSGDVWIVLERRFLDQSTAKELQLKLQLQSLKKVHQSMAQYLRTLKSLAGSLSVINSPVSNKDLVIYALVGLSSKYESFITTVTKNNTILSFDDLRTKLLYHEQRLNHLYDILHSDTETALLAAPIGRGRGRGRDHSSFGHAKGRGGQGRGIDSHIFLMGSPLTLLWLDLLHMAHHFRPLTCPVMVVVYYLHLLLLVVLHLGLCLSAKYATNVVTLLLIATTVLIILILRMMGSKPAMTVAETFDAQ
ncbi:hypothetical protein RJ640_027103 [Escallonia rubra]|uniref:Uncharacterized protein n=1 Tax=Escallonia rubra TaxID=112253 RepID=A0AA88R3D8_9ASTE|nr:hypothetical protein RJ640_027103 [Escallonia rubra]